MNRSTFDTDAAEIADAMVARCAATAPLEWGIYTVDPYGRETLVGATVDQEAAIAVSVALGDGPARHMRVRRLR
jgi:hypothetical protein